MTPEEGDPYIDDSIEEGDAEETEETEESDREESRDFDLAEEEIVEANYTINACLDENSANFYEYTPFQDCNGDVIAATYLENPDQAKWVDCGCPDCNLEIFCDYNSPSIFGGTDGYIIAGVIGEDRDPESTTFGDDIATGTANYTYVIEPVNAEDAGKGAGSTIGSGATSNTKFTFGYNINLEQTGAVGNPTYAISSLKGYIPAVSTSGTSTKGLEAGTYNIYVFDANSTASCLAKKQIILVNPPRIAGCTDNNTGTNDGAALNYSANASIDNNSCIYCKAADGKLVDYQSVNYLGTGDIIENFNIQIQAATDSDNTDGVIQFSATPISLFKTYIEDVIDGNGHVDAAYKLELYPLTETQFSNKTISGATKLGSTVSNTDEGSKFNYTFNSINGYNVTYGRYAVKVFIDDPDDGEIDGCYQLRFLTVPVLAGKDNSKPNTYVTANSVTITNKQLVNVSAELSGFANTDPCCDDPVITLESPAYWAGYTIEGVNYDACAWGISLSYDCSSDPDNNAIHHGEWQLQYDDPTLGWIDVPETISGCVTPAEELHAYGFYWYPYPAPQYNPGICGHYAFGNNGPIITSQLPGSSSNSFPGSPQNATFVIPPSSGDGDYRIKQTIVNTGIKPQCIKYSNVVTVVALVCGCTDATASNYNASATTDDGTCNAVIPADPCLQSTASLTVTTWDATGSCAAPNSDGTAIVNVTILSGATTWTIRYNVAGVWGAWSSPYTANGDAAPEIGLAPGVYIAEVEDSSGCFTTLTYSIGNSTSGCGCMDPGASNYDATATTDDGSCLYPGCTDPNAINYNPTATSDDGSCEYEPVSGSTDCIPPYITDLTDKIKTCIAENGYNFYYELISGRADDCSIMNAWKLILIDYLIDPVGLDCIYNCADSSTPAAGDLKTCADKWVTGGPATGINDMAYAGSSITTGEGTTITDPALFFVQTTQLYNGDVIKMPSGLIYIIDDPYIGVGGVAFGGQNPETTAGVEAGHWKQCTESMNQISFSDTTNYLDIFSSFVNKFCAHCGTEPYCKVTRDIATPFGGNGKPTNGRGESTEGYSNYLED